MTDKGSRIDHEGVVAAGSTMLMRIWRDFRRHDAVRRLRTNERPDPALDRLAEMAAQAFDAPIAVLSLIDRDTMWLRGVHGIERGHFPRCETFCHHTLDRGDVLEVCAPQDDPRFAGLMSVVGDIAARYYIGAAIQSRGGIDIGTLCILDVSLRAPASADQRAYLHALARRATEMLELRTDCAMAGR